MFQVEISLRMSTTNCIIDVQTFEGNVLHFTAPTNSKESLPNQIGKTKQAILKEADTQRKKWQETNAFACKIEAVTEVIKQSLSDAYNTLFDHAEEIARQLIKTNKHTLTTDYPMYVWGSGLASHFSKSETAEVYTAMAIIALGMHINLDDILISSDANATAHRAMQQYEQHFKLVRNPILSQSMRYLRHAYDVQSKMDALEEIFANKITTGNAVRFWAAKEKSHRTRGEHFTCAFLVFLVVGLVVGVGVIAVSSTSLMDSLTALVHGWPMKGANTPDKESIAVLHTNGNWLSGLAVGGFFWIWFLRFLSHHADLEKALQTDAGHRRMLVQTLLSLQKEQRSNLNDVERALMLEALFRPTVSPTKGAAPPIETPSNISGMLTSLMK